MRPTRIRDKKMKSQKIVSIFALVVSAFILANCYKENPNKGITSIELNYTTLELGIGQTQTLAVVRILPDDANDKTVTWTNSTPAIASFDTNNGTVRALSKGSTNITAKAGKVSVTCIVTVTETAVPVEKITLDKTNLMLEKGKSFTLTATVEPANATNRTVSWSSSTNKVSVDKNGKVTAIDIGEATIRAQAGDKIATCTVTVVLQEIPVDSISLSYANLFYTSEENASVLDLFSGYSGFGVCSKWDEICANTIYFIATVKPDNASNKKVSWTSSNHSVVEIREINSYGSPVRPYVYVKGKGTSIITAQAGGKTAFCTVNVLEIMVDSETELVIGEERTIIATTDPAGQPITWISSNTSIATVEGVYKEGKVIAKAPGTTTIKATYNGQTVSCNVTVFDIPHTGVTIDGVTWAAHNIDAPGTFAEKVSDSGMLYQWNSKIGYTTNQWIYTFVTGTEWSSDNDPSPSGWRIPTLNEGEKMLSKVINNKGRQAIVNGQECIVLKFEYDQHLVFRSDHFTFYAYQSNYWTNTPYQSDYAYVYVARGSTGISARSNMLRVRCVKNENV